MNIANFRIISDIIKTSLSKRKLKYVQLAEYLGMSESGVKKIFLGEDISLNKLIKICNFLDIEVGHLLKSAEETPRRRIKIQPNAEQFFLKNPNYFHFYWELMVLQSSLEEIKEKYNLTDLTIQKYLLKLDNIGIIKLEPENKVLTNFKGFSAFGGFSDLEINMVNYIRREFLEYAVNESLVAKVENDGPVMIRTATNSGMKPETFKMMKTEIGDIVNKYQEKSKQERSIIDKKNLVPIGAMFVAAPFEYFNIFKIPNLE